MIVDKNLLPYIVLAEDTVLSALKKISDNKIQIVFSVLESGVLEGSLTDGDFRRWLVGQQSIDLSVPVSELTNKNPKTAQVNDAPEKIEGLLGDSIRVVPLLDPEQRLVAVARQRTKSFKLGSFTIDAESPSFVIAEIGINHNGSLDLAKKLIDLAVESGADCAKFQMRSMTALYREAGLHKEDLGAQYTLDLLSRFQLTPQEMYEAFDHCKAKGILPLCTPWDLESLILLESYGMEAYKVASADLTNHDLLEALAKTGKPLICSTGMSEENEVKEAVALFRRLGAQYVLLHCNSTYPAPFKDINLNYLDRLKDIGLCPIGYSGHERGISVAIAAVAKGAKVIEKHFTIDKAMEGNDHKVSLLPDEFKSMVQGIREVEQALGLAGARRLTQGELMNRANLAKSLVINCDLAAGEIITDQMIEVKSPGQGLQPNRKAELIGQRTKRAFNAGDFFFPSDLCVEVVQPRPYSFRRPWGVPVRYHDFKAILEKSNPDFLEFHLSYKDMELDLHQFFDRSYELDLVVHSPDLFPGDHLLNLAAADEDYRKRSVRELQRVIDITRELKPYFKRTTRPLIVASLGGFTKDAPIPVSERTRYYDLIEKSLLELDQEGVELIAQTLPPFPWYFGGQLYLNLFVDPEDTIAFCQRTGLRLCLDISHSKLACNLRKSSFKEFIDRVGPHSAHLHIVDAAGVDSEGLQIGEGDIDWPALAEDLARTAPGAGFIPEIWMGHKNEGEGFWVALERLEQWF